MEQEYHGLINNNFWNRKAINIYWFAAVFFILGELACLFFINFSRKDPMQYVIRYLFIPWVLYLVIMLMTEILFRKLKSMSPLLIAVCGTMMATVLVWAHDDVDGITAIYILPLLVSTTYFSKRHIYFLTAINSLSFILIYAFDPVFHKKTSRLELFVQLVVIIVAAFYSVQIMNRGHDIFNALKNLMQSKQELMIQKITLDMMVKVDMLTGLYNHNTFHEFLGNLIEQATTHRVPIHLALIDIDNFKKVNDIYGHRAGDIVLKRVADIIKSFTGPDDFAFRYGGEEFAVIFVEKSSEEAYAAAEGIRQAVASTPNEELDSRCITISIGFKEYTYDDSKDSFFNDADNALYDAKNNGKNQTRIAQTKWEFNKVDSQ